MSRIAMFVGALALAPLAAQAQMAQPAAPVANPIVGAFKASGENYGRLLVAAFDSIPYSLYTYKPTPAQLSIAHIAVHLEGANYEICQAFSGMTRPMTARDSTADSVKATWPKDSLVARVRASFAFCDQALDRVTDAALAQDVRMPFGPPRPVAAARLAIIYLTDLADHYSQLANYMRLNNLTPPSALRRPRM